MSIKIVVEKIFKSMPIHGILAIVCVSSCTKTPPTDDGVVSSVVEERTNHQVRWNQGCLIDDQIKWTIQCLLESELTVEGAVQTALLNNPQIQSVFEELGIAHADLVEAGLLTNPAFSIEVRYPTQKRLKTNIEYMIATSFLDIFLIPLRKRIAATEFEQAKLKAANEILNLVFEVRETYYALLAEKQKIKSTYSLVKLIGIHFEIASQQKAVGNINSLEFQLMQSRFLEASLQIAKSEAEIIQLTEKLYRLLGLSQGMCLFFPEHLPPEDYQGFERCTLESIALRERLDLQTARFEAIRLAQLMGLKQGWTYTDLNLGLAGEREPDGVNFLGPGFSGQLPIFNYGQAARMHLKAKLRQAQDRIAVLEIQVMSEVREAHQLLMIHLKNIQDYRDHILPTQNKTMEYSLQLYNVMGLGINRLIENKELEIIAQRNYLDMVKDYLISRVKLDQALGGNLFLLLEKESCMERETE